MEQEIHEGSETKRDTEIQTSLFSLTDVTSPRLPEAIAEVRL